MNHGLETLDFSSIRKKLYSAVIADCLDTLGFRQQAMDGEISAIEPSFTLAGRAYTMLAGDACEGADDPYARELEAVDSLREGDILVASVEGSGAGALWGELLSTAALTKGARGAVIDGLARDGNRIVQMGFPVFVRGFSPLDSKGRIEVVAHGEPIRCGGIPVSTGDIVFGDRDGVVIVPEEVATEVLHKAAEKADGENGMRDALRQGMGIMEAYRKYGVL
jgi:4-hydroxy-4-methyl-2-oxoglutarate aldolase